MINNLSQFVKDDFDIKTIKIEFKKWIKLKTVKYWNLLIFFKFVVRKKVNEHKYADYHYLKYFFLFFLSSSLGCLQQLTLFSNKIQLKTARIYSHF